MINHKPLVSFVIPTHNRAGLLKECLDSVLSQTYNNFEVVVVNDNSSDDTEEVLKTYSAKYDNFYYYNNNGNGGNAARNLGVVKAAGEYIAFMDDDDICESYRIEKQIKPIIDSNFYYNFVISGYSTFKEKGNILAKIDYLKPLASIGYPQRWLLKKKLIMDACYFDNNQPALQDVEFFWRLKSIGNLYFSNISVVNIRVSTVSITKDTQKMIRGIVRLLDLHGDKMNLYERNTWIISLCKKHASVGNWTEFRLLFKKVNKSMAPLSSLALFFSLFFKSSFPLNVHSRMILLLSSLKFKYNN